MRRVEMKKIISILVAVFFMSAPFISRAEQPDVNLKEENSRLTVFHEKKRTTIYFTNKLDPAHELNMTFDLKKRNEIRDFLEWEEKGIPNKTIKKARIEIIESQNGKRKKKIKKVKVKDRKLRTAYLEAFRRLHYPDGMFFYLLSKEGKVVEIQGLDDYLSILYATMGGTLPANLTFVRNRISLLALQDLCGVANEGSKALAAKLRLANPFFLTLDDALSGIKLAADLYKYAKKDQRAFKLLGAAQTDYDKCLLFLTDPGARALMNSRKGFEAAWSACKAIPNSPIQVAKAMGRALFLNVRLKVLHKSDFDYAQKVIRENNTYVRSLYEKHLMRFYLAATEALRSDVK